MLIKKKYDSCTPNQNKYTVNIAYHDTCGYSITTVRNHTKESITAYHRGIDSLSNLCKNLREQALELLNTKKLPMTPLTKDQQQEYANAEQCHICNRKFITDPNHKHYKKLIKVMDHDHYTGKYRGAAYNICNLRYETQKDIPVVIHNGSNYVFHLIITELTKEFRSDMKCIGANTEKYMSFSVPLKKLNENGKFTTYRLKFIDSARFMMGSLSNHVDNLSELYNCNCEDKKKQRISIKNKKDTLATRCKTCNNRSKQNLQDMINRFPSTYKLSNSNINKFILLLRKGVYPYEYMDDWERFNETELPSQDKFYSELNKEHIADEDYRHAKNIWSVVKIKYLGEYHDLYIQLDTALLADVFEKFRNLCLTEHKLDPAYFVSTPGLAMEACLKMTGVKLELLTDIDMVLMFEKGIRGGITQTIRRYASAYNKYMKTYNKDLPSSFLMCLDANNLYGWAMCKKLPLNNYKWQKILIYIHLILLKTMMEIAN